MRKRIIKYLEYKGITKYQFYKETGLSNGFLDKDSDISFESYKKIGSRYLDLNIDWVHTGEGEMLKPHTLRHSPKINTVKSRIYAFLKHINMPVSKFEKKCGLSNGYISSMRKGFGTGKLSNILSEFPELNRDWLLFGEGTMLTAERDKSYVVTSDTETVGVDNIATTTGKCSGRDSITHNHHMMNNYNAPDIETLHRQYEATIARLEEIIREQQETIRNQQGTINRLQDHSTQLLELITQASTSNKS